MYRIRKAITFEAAHQLPNHDGKCRNLHGHSYKVEAFFVGPWLVPTGKSIPQEGMLVDFTVIGAALKELHALVDHTFLNDVVRERLGVPVTTAELLARGFYLFLVERLETLEGFRATVEKVRVWETASAYAEYSQP